MSSSPLPAVPPGVNPFTVYLAALHEAYYPTPSPGFKTRLIVLYVVLSLGLLSSFTYMVFYAINSRRGNQGYGAWVVRMVEKPSGSYIVINTKIIASGLSVVNSTLELAFVHDMWDVYLKGGKEGQSFTWRNVFCFTLVAHGWLISWGLLQAFLLAPDQKRIGVILRPVVANTLFLVGTVLCLGATLGVGTASTVAGTTMWSKYMAVAEELTYCEGSWTGSVTPDQAARLQLTMGHLSDAVSRWDQWDRIEYGLVGAVCLVIVVVNLGAVGLTRKIRRHIKDKVGQMNILSTAAYNVPLSPSEKAIGLNLTAPFGSPLTSSATPLPPSRKAIRVMAREKETMGIHTEHAKGIQALQKAERDLIVFSVGCAGMALISASTVLYVSIESNTSTTSGIPWPRLEYMLLSVTWLFSVAIVFTTTGLTINGFVNMPRHSPNRDVETILVTGNATSSATGTIRTMRDFFSFAALEESRGETTSFSAGQITVDVERIEVADSYVDCKEKDKSKFAGEQTPDVDLGC